MPTKSDIEFQALATMLKKTGFTREWFESCCLFAANGNRRAAYLVDYSVYLILKDTHVANPEPQWSDYAD